MVDFTKLLEKQVDSVEAPKPLPVGSYKALVGKHKFDKSAKKQTDFVRFDIKPIEALEDVDQEELEKAGGLAAMQKVTLRQDYYLTEDALYRLRKFLEENCRLSCEGRSFQEVIPETENAEIIVQLKHRLSEDGQSKYMEIGTIASV